MHLETCRSCGGELDRQGNYYVCRFCGNKWMIDAAEDVHVVDRANAWAALRDCDFEKAAELFENIIFKDKNNHEAYWGRALALAGIIYVTDFHENKRVPTCNNISESSFLESRDVKRAIELAPSDIADAYRTQAENIEAIRAEWVRKARREPPYDVFICFKDSDREAGVERTSDSFSAHELYIALKSEGYKVFFSRVSLRDKVSEHYEPYIYNALKTAKVMIVYGEKTEYFSAVWVKNEWLRFRNMIERGEKPENSLVVAYKGIDPADLPTGLRARQCMNAAEFTFFDDLKAHIKSVIRASANKQSATQTKPPEAQTKTAEAQPKPANSYVPRPEAQKEPVRKQEEPKTAIPEEHFMSPKAKKIAIVAVVVALAIIFGIAAPSLFSNERTPEVPDERPYETEQIQVPGSVEPFEPASTDIPTAEETEDEPEETTQTVPEPDEYFSIDGMSFRLNDDKKSYTLSNGPYGVTEVVIPETCNGLPVTAIADEAFYNRPLTSITIPDTVVSIGAKAFGSCRELSSFTFPDALKNIGKNAFYCCDSLTGIVLPDGVESIGESAFYECRGLESAYLGNKLTVIESSVFLGCTSLTTVNIPKTVTTVENYAFKNCSSLSGEIILPDGVTSIGEEAFYNCAAITKVTLGSGIKTIGDEAFYGCTALAEINLPEGLESIGASAFYNCDGIKTLIIPESLTKLGGSAFYSCDSLESVEILAKLSSISGNMFYNCRKLTSVTLPETITEIGYNAFGDCSVETVVFEGSWAQWESISFTDTTLRGSSEITCQKPMGDQTDKLVFVENDDGGYTLESNNGAMGDVVIPATYNGKPVTAIGENCFNTQNYRYKITSVTIPDSVKSIGKYAFGSCGRLKTVTFGSESKLEEIVEAAFYDCDSLESINLPGGLQEIPKEAFYSCDSLVSLSLPDGILTVGEKAFMNCASLENISFPEDLVSIGINAFSGCTSLESVKLPESLVSIGKNVFDGCTALISINIPSSIESIGADAFYNCQSLEYNVNDGVRYLGNAENPYLVLVNTESKSRSEYEIPAGVKFIFPQAFNSCAITTITIPDSVISIGEKAFEGCNSLVSMTLPAISPFYKLFNTTAPSTLTSITVVGSEISASAFSGCKNITSVTVSESVKVIRSFAFENCTGLVSLTLNEGLVTIEGSAFKGCVKLEGVNVPGSVESIGTYAFENCKAMTFVDFGGVKIINEQAFKGCTGLSEITLPESLETVKGGAFEGCSGLTVMTVPFVGEGKDGSGYGYFYHLFNRYGGSSSDMPSSLTTVIITGGETIRNNAFSGCSRIQSITLPDTLKTISEYAFKGCYNLKGINIPEGVEKIGSKAFSECSNLTYINIPDSIESIEGSAFDGCNSLNGYVYGNSVYLGNSNNNYLVLWKGTDSSISSCTVAASTKIICSGAFKEYKSLSSLTFEENSSLKTIGSAAFYYCSALKTEIVIPEGVEFIGSSAFLRSGITSVTLPSTLRTLDGYVFENCSNLNEVNFAEGIETIGDSTFKGCVKLKNVVIPASVQYIGNFVFADSEALESITVAPGNQKYHAENNCLIETETKTLIAGCKTGVIPDDGSVTAIAEGAFYYCKMLSAIVIPESVTYIGRVAFYNCEYLMSVTFVAPGGWWCSTDPEATEGTGFSESGLSNSETAATYLRSTYNEHYWFREVSEEETETNTESAETESGSLVEYSEELEFTSNGDGTTCSVSGIGNCEDIDITIPPVSPEGLVVTAIEQGAFIEEISIINVTIPDSVTYIGDNAFLGCSSLTSVYIPSSVSRINQNAFRDCSKIESVVVEEGNAKYHSARNCLIETESKTLILGCVNSTIPDDGSVTNIGIFAFSYCTYLKSISVPDSIETIGEYAFCYCTGLESIIIPDSVTRIGSYVFVDCPNLKTIYYTGNAEDWAAIEGVADAEIPEGCEIVCNYVGYSEGLKFTPNDDGTTCYVSGIGDCNDTNIVIPSTSPEGLMVTGIGGYAFNGCSNLTSITIPESVVSIGEYAFSGCTALASATFENAEGWCYYRSFFGEVFGEVNRFSSTDLAKPSTAAAFLRLHYYEYCWNRTE